MWDVFITIIFSEQRTPSLITGIIGFILIVLTLSVLLAWATHKVFKKISGHKQ